MNPTYKICIYFRSKEKPVILTDISTKDASHASTIEYFKDVLRGENKIVSLDFANDNLTFNCKDVEAIKISKPVFNTANFIVSNEDENEQPLNLNNSKQLKKNDLLESPEEEADEKIFQDDVEDVVVIKGA